MKLTYLVDELKHNFELVRLVIKKIKWVIPKKLGGMNMREFKMPDINIKVGQTTEVALTERPGTGYTWVLVHKPDCLWLENIHIIVPDKDIAVGIPIKKVFTFEGAEKCQDYVEFVLVRPFDLKDIAQKMTYALIITE